MKLSMQSSPPSCSSSSLASSMKLKTLIQNFILSRVTRILTKAKSAFLELMNEMDLKSILILVPLLFKKNINKNKQYLDSFRFHYHWSSSHLVPKSTCHHGFNDFVYDPLTNSVKREIEPESQLSGYLHWLEEKNIGTHEIGENIDDLADKFIANCHQKFNLEKQDSERRFQEMMARSI